MFDLILKELKAEYLTDLNQIRHGFIRNDVNPALHDFSRSLWSIPKYLINAIASCRQYLGRHHLTTD